MKHKHAYNIKTGTCGCGEVFKVPKTKFVSVYKKNLFKTKKVQKKLKKIMPEYYD